MNVVRAFAQIDVAFIADGHDDAVARLHFLMLFSTFS
jgi:hypothetical protein